MAGCYEEVRKGNRLRLLSRWLWGAFLEPIFTKLLELGFVVAAELSVIRRHVVFWVRQPARQAHPSVG